MPQKVLTQLLMMMFLLIGFTPTSHAEEYTLEWYSIDGGAAECSGAEYVFYCSIGQPDAENLTGDLYTMEGGYMIVEWFPCIVNMMDLVYLANDWLATGDDLLADINEDKSVDYIDLSIIAAYWLKFCPPDWPM